MKVAVEASEKAKAQQALMFVDINEHGLLDKIIDMDRPVEHAADPDGPADHNQVHVFLIHNMHLEPTSFLHLDYSPLLCTCSLPKCTSPTSTGASSPHILQNL